MHFLKTYRMNILITGIHRLPRSSGDLTDDTTCPDKLGDEIRKGRMGELANLRTCGIKIPDSSR